MKKQYKVEKDCLRTITFNFNNPLEKSISKYLKTLKEEKGLNPKDCIIDALISYCEPEIIEAAGGSDLDVAIAKRKSALQLEARSKLLMFELGLDGESDREEVSTRDRPSDRVIKRQDDRSLALSKTAQKEEEEEEEEEEVKSKTIFFDGFPPD